MRWLSFIACGLVSMASGCHVFGGVRLAELATTAGKPSNVATVVSVTQKGQPVAGLGVADFHLSEDGQALDPVAVDLRLLDPSTVAAFHTVLLLDLSHGTSEERKRQLSRAAASFVRKVRQKQAITVLAFDGSPRTRLVGDFTFEANGSGPDQFENLMMMVPTDPSRNLNGAVISALDILDGRLERSNRPLRLGTLVVFSRGPDVAGRVPTSEFDERVEHSEHQFIYVSVAGDPTNGHVAALTRRGKVEAQASDTLPIAFEDAAMLANKLTTEYYLLSYCSPARAGERQLRVEVQINGAEGQTESDAFETKFDASGFSPSCNSGNPPRFTTAPHASGERAAGAGKSAASVTAPAEAAVPTNGIGEPAPNTVETQDGDAADVEVPPPKKRGYAP